MGYKKYVKQAFQDNDGVSQDRLIEWRRQPATKRVDNPTKPHRASSLGYKAKQGVFVVRQRVMRGGRQRPQFKAGRKSSNYGRRKVLNKSYQDVAENRVSEQHPNCEVIGSYIVGEDGGYEWYEVLVVDPDEPSVQADDDLRDAASRRGRSERSLNSASTKSRDD
jgi:large subunit ribosomal protein L15e